VLEEGDKRGKGCLFLFMYSEILFIVTNSLPYVTS
jgi:hypothetical protein